MQVNKEAGRREHLERMGAQRHLGPQISYATGSNVAATGADQYLLYVLLSGTSVIDSRHALGYGTSGGNVMICEVRKSSVPTPDEVVTPAGIVSLVRKVFGLSVSDAASAFRVSRPTIYQWAEQDNIELVRSREDRERMRSLYRLARAWEARERVLGRWQKDVLANGSSVFDMLCAPVIDTKAVLKAHESLLAAQGRLHREEHQRAVSAVSALKGAFERLAENEKQRQKGRV